MGTHRIWRGEVGCWRRDWGGWRSGGGSCVGWGPMGGLGWKSQQWKWQCGERGAWLHWDSMREGAACSAQSERHKERVLLSTSNGPLDNHTGTKLLYLTLIAKTAAPPSQSRMTPQHFPATSQPRAKTLSWMEFIITPSSISTLIVILRLVLGI